MRVGPDNAIVRSGAATNAPDDTTAPATRKRQPENPDARSASAASCNRADAGRLADERPAGSPSDAANEGRAPRLTCWTCSTIAYSRNSRRSCNVRARSARTASWYSYCASANVAMPATTANADSIQTAVSTMLRASSTAPGARLTRRRTALHSPAPSERQRGRREWRQRRAAQRVQHEFDVEEVTGERDQAEDATGRRGDRRRDRGDAAARDLQQRESGAQDDEADRRRGRDSARMLAALSERCVERRRVEPEVDAERVFRERRHADQRDQRARVGADAARRFGRRQRGGHDADPRHQARHRGCDDDRRGVGRGLHQAGQVERVAHHTRAADHGGGEAEQQREQV